jgi:hypothetical protein
MSLGVSLFLIAVGAVLIWAVNASVQGVDLDVVGWILLIVGAFGAFLSLVVFESSPLRRRTTVYEDDDRRL